MKKINSLFLLYLFFTLVSCGTVKEGFKNQKKDSSDEFLVEKKSPLVMPPEYNELPVPKDKENQTQSDNNKIKNLISSEDVNSGNSNNGDNAESLEKVILKKIKSN